MSEINAKITEGISVARLMSAMMKLVYKASDAVLESGLVREACHSIISRLWKYVPPGITVTFIHR
jgi:hypothetical protein